MNTQRHVVFGKAWLAGTLTAAVWLFAAVETRPSPAAELEPPGEAEVRVRGSCILTHPDSGDLVRYAAQELQKYLRLLSAGEVTAKSAEKLEDPPAGKALFVLGSARQLRRIEGVPKVFLEKIASLKPEGFTVTTLKVAKGRVVLVGASDDAGVLYGVYDLLERLGCFFQTTGDMLPEPRSDVALPELDYTRAPLLRKRGFLTHPCYPQVGLFSLDDWRGLLDQMAKLKMNYLIFYWFVAEPWIRYEYQGEVNQLGGVLNVIESGSLLWPGVGHCVRTAEMPVGADKFPYPHLAPREFQDFATHDELFDAAAKYLQGLIAHAHRRNIEVWLGFDPVMLPENLTKHAQNVRFNKHIFGGACGPNDPVLREINRARLASVFNTYPEADGYFLWFPEHCYTDKRPESLKLYQRERPRYEAALNHFTKHWTRGRGDRERVWMDYLCADIGAIEIFKDVLSDKEQIDRKRRMGIASFGKGYVFPMMDKLFPRDVAFNDMESAAVWSPAGAPFHLLADMGQRERIITPRLDEDTSVISLQFNVTLFLYDKVISSCLKNGLAGFAGQHYRFRGGEQNSRFLAEAAWEKDLDCPTFYHRYCQRIFGAKAGEQVARAMLIMEDNDKVLGWRNWGGQPAYGGHSSETSAMARFGRDPKKLKGPPYPNVAAYVGQKARYEPVLQRLQKAQSLLSQARPNVQGNGQHELEYLASRLKVYEHLLHWIVETNTALIQCHQAFGYRDSDPTKFLEVLRGMQTSVDRAYEAAMATGQEQARFVAHPSELAVLAFVNSGVIKHTRDFQQFVHQLVAFHEEPGN